MNNLESGAALVISLALASTPALAAPLTYRVVALQVNGFGGYANANAMKGNWVAATYTQNGGGSTPFRCQGNLPCRELSGLPRPGGGRTAADVNRLGTVVGVAHNEYDSRGFFWTVSGVVQYIPTYNADCPWQIHLSSSATAINNRGDIVGNTQDCTSSRPYLRSGGKMHFLPLPEGVVALDPTDINEDRVVAGSAWKVDGTTEVFTFRGKKTQLLGSLGGTWARASAINKRGVIVGCSATPDDAGSLAFVYGDSGMVALPPLDAGGGCAESLNDKGVIVGADRLAGKTVGFVYLEGTTYALDALLTEPDRARWHIERAVGIANDGVIAATAIELSTGQVKAVRLEAVLAR